MADPAPSTPPTNVNKTKRSIQELNIEEFQKLVRTLQGKPPVSENVKTIKDFCALLRTIGSSITDIAGEYDGSGDSGSMDVNARIPALNTMNTTPGNTVINNVQNTNTHVYRGLLQALDTELKDPEIQNIGLTRKRIDDLENAMYSLLPGGWEINDGSYGSIDIEVSTGAIEVTHNERYTEVNTSVKNY
jgi:hypothetical protein